MGLFSRGRARSRRPRLLSNLALPALLALGSCATVAPPAAPRPTRPFTIPRATLLGREFAKASFGPAKVTRADAGEAGVRFYFTGLADAVTGLKDDYPVDAGYGQARPSHGNGDFSAFDGLALSVANVGEAGVWVCLFINTGFTGSSGRPPDAPSNDTFWAGPWRRLEAGEAAVLWLNFDRAAPAHVADNQPPHTQSEEGKPTAIGPHDRREISAVGFLVRAADAPKATLLVRQPGRVPRAPGPSP